MSPDHSPEPAAEQARLYERLSQIIDGAGDCAEHRREVAAAVANDPRVRRWYIDLMLLEADLDEAHVGTAGGDVVDLLADGSGGPQRRWRHLRLAAAVALLLAVAGGVGSVVAWQAVASIEREAALGQISKARMALPPTGSATGQLAPGRLLGRERMTVESGGIEVTLRGGGIIVVEGRAAFDLLTENSIFLHRGNLVVRQPARNGRCVIETPAAAVEVELGECGVAVTESLETDVQNFSGTTLVQRHLGQFPLRLDAQTAVRLSAAEPLNDKTLAFDSGRFLRRLSASPGVPRRATPGKEGFFRSFGRPQVGAISIPRTNGPVEVDGELDEWPTEPAFRATRAADGSGPDWLEGWMLYDPTALYIAARVGDPLPLRNAVDPAERLETLWHGGALQLFLSLDRGLGWPAEGKPFAYFNCRHIKPPLAEEVKAANPRLLTLFLWHHVASDTDRLAITTGLGSDAVEAADGYEGRFVPAADGQGYVLEYRIPWTTLRVADDPPQPGDHLATCWELHYSDETGRLWRDQIIEVRNPDEPAAIYPFESAATWGRADFQ
jgi:hypothetical protein